MICSKSNFFSCCSAFTLPKFFIAQNWHVNTSILTIKIYKIWSLVLGVKHKRTTSGVFVGIHVFLNASVVVTAVNLQGLLIGSLRVDVIWNIVNTLLLLWQLKQSWRMQMLCSLGVLLTSFCTVTVFHFFRTLVCKKFTSESHYLPVLISLDKA